MEFLSENGLTSPGSDAVVTVILALLTLASAIALVVYICKYANGGTVAHKKTALAVILAAGFVLRLIFALCIRGYRADYDLIYNVFTSLRNNSGSGYVGNASLMPYPVVYFVYVIFGGLSNIIGLTDFALGAQFMIKLPLIICDLLSALAVYKIADGYFNARVALACAAFVCVCPIFFIGSAVWTSTLVFTVMFACWGCYFLVKKNYATTIAFFTAAAFSSKEGIFLFPVAAVFSIYHIVRAVKNILKDHPKGKDILSDDYKAVIWVPVGFVLSLLGAWVIGMPLIYSYSYNIFKYIFEFTLEPLADWTYFTYNGTSIYTLFGQNGESHGARFPTGVFIGIFSAILLAVICIVYFTRRNRATVVMLAAYSLFTMQVFYPGSTAIGMQSTMLILLAAYILVKDKRLLYVLFVAGLAYVINALGVLCSAGYLSNFESHMFIGDAYTGSTLMKDAYGVLTVLCSILTVAAHLYFTYVTVTVGMTGQKKLLGEADGIGGSLKEFLFGNTVTGPDGIKR